MVRKTIKGSIVTEFCAENPIEGENGKENFPNKDILDVELGAWKIYMEQTIWKLDRSNFDYP